MQTAPRARVAILAGLRTPFVKQATDYRNYSARHLGQWVVRELLERSQVSATDIQRVIYGQVIPSPQAPNIAREVVLGAGLPVSTDAYSVSRACATSYQTTVNLLESILAGDIECGISGGADSASDIPITLSRPAANALLQLSRARSLGQKFKAIKPLKLRDLLPKPPALREPSSHYSMGEAAEKMARENNIARAAQDEIAHTSHAKASRAWAKGLFDNQVMATYTSPAFNTVIKDNLVRDATKLEDYAKLKPVFDRRHGTITAANSSPLTDGASALLLMREDKAKALGLDILGYIKSYAFTAIDPNDQMLMGPAYTTPVALDRAGLTLKDMDLIDMHEAFAAQVLSNTNAFASKRFAEEKLGRSTSIGEIDFAKFNITGSSIALGHPFAATGARQILQMLHDLKRNNGQFGLCTACAAGGLGAAMILEANHDE